MLRESQDVATQTQYFLNACRRPHVSSCGSHEDPSDSRSESGPDSPSPEAVSCSTAGQAPQVTFRAGVDLVDVEVSVLDKNRLPVRGLTASDFTVLEEGSPRPVVAFTAVDLPPRIMPPAPWMEQIAADTHTNSFAREGRLIVILMDRTIAPERVPGSAAHRRSRP